MLSLHRPAGLSSPYIPYILPSSAPSCPSLPCSAMIPQGNPIDILWCKMGSYARYKLDHTHITTNTHWFYCLPMCVYYIAFSSILSDNFEWKTQWINMNGVLLSPLTETDMIYWLPVGASNCYLWTMYAQKQPLKHPFAYIHTANTHSMCLTKGKSVRNVTSNFHLLCHTGVTNPTAHYRHLNLPKRFFALPAELSVWVTSSI